MKLPFKIGAVGAAVSIFLGMNCNLDAATPLDTLQSAVSDLARLQELRAINQTEAVLEQGLGPNKWPYRVFLPQSTINASLQILTGGVTEIPIGTVQNNRVDGYAKITVSKIGATLRNAGLGADLAVTVEYDPDLVKAPLGGAAIPLSISALLLPASQQIDDNGLVTILKIVPVTIGIGKGVANIDSAMAFLAQVGLSKILVAWGDHLQVSIPTLASKTPVDLSFKSDNQIPFKNGKDKVGEATLRVVLDRKPETLALALDRTIVTQSGVWLVGGLPPKAIPVNPSTDTPPSQATLDQRRKELGSKLASFSNPDKILAIGISGLALTNFVDSLVGGPPLSVSASSIASSGIIQSANALKDNILGDVGYSITPDGAAFANGQIVVKTSPANWNEKNGVTAQANASVTASTKLVVHLKAGRVDEDIKIPMVLNGSGAAAVSLGLAFEQRNLKTSSPSSSASAIVVRPNIGCTQATIDIQPGAKITQNWVAVSPIGLRIIQRTGGQKISPAFLLDSLPNVIEAPVEKDATGKPVSRLPTKAVTTLKHPFIQAQFTTNPPVLDSAGVTLRAELAITPRDSAESASEKKDRDALRAAITSAIPDNGCDTSSEIWLTGGGLQVLNVSKEIQFVVDSANRKVKIAEDAWKVITNITAAKPEELVKLPVSAFTDNVADIKHGIDVLRNVPVPAAPSVPLPGGGSVTPAPIPKKLQDVLTPGFHVRLF